MRARKPIINWRKSLTRSQLIRCVELKLDENMRLSAENAELREAVEWVAEWLESTDRVRGKRPAEKLRETLMAIEAVRAKLEAMTKLKVEK
jgi:hypothetical protein